jgi:hypothetical protein
MVEQKIDQKISHLPRGVEFRKEWQYNVKIQAYFGVLEKRSSVLQINSFKIEAFILFSSYVRILCLSRR